MAVSFSADGLRWSKAIDCPEIDAHGDTHNVALWAPDMGKHIVFTRINAGDNTRQVARTESKDFVNWTKAKVVLKGSDPLKQTHDLVVFPTGGVYIGLLGVMEFIERSNYNVKQHIELAWSPDTVTWYRIEEGKRFIANSPAEKAGIETGDVILSYNGKELHDSSMLPPLVGSSRIDRPAEVVILRGGKKKTLQVDIGELPDDEESLAESRSGGDEQSSRGPCPLPLFWD